jgi:carbamoyl-phosphate synthase large subunit
MAIGRTFQEAIQKGLRMIGQGMHGFVDNKAQHVTDVPAALKHATDTRIFVIAKAMQDGYTIDQIHSWTKIDKWFLQKLHHIITIDQRLQQFSYLSELAECMEHTEFMEIIEASEFISLLREAKVYGFSDFQIARALDIGGCRTSGSVRMNMEEAGLIIRSWRKELEIVPLVNQIDTLAAEYPANTNYLYLSYL